jgi:hypothetical protein
MTITFLQPDGVPITAQAERQGSAALYGGGADRRLGGRSGFRVDTPSNILTATSTTWTLTPCSAQIDPGATTHQGMYGWATDANVTGSVTAADATNPRKDIVYIQINDSTAGDGSGATTANVSYLAGTPAPVGEGTPAAPTLPARSFLVGTISVPVSGGGSPTVVLNPARFVAAGGVLPVSSQTEMDALTPYKGMEVYRSDLDLFCRYNGAAWSAVGAHEEFTSTSSGVSNNTAWGPGVPSLDSSQSNTPGFGSWPSDDVFQTSVAGLYSFHWLATFTSAAGPCYMSIRRNPSGTTLTSHQWPSAYEHDLTLPAVRLAANEQVKLIFVQTSGGTITSVPHRVRVTKWA